MFFGSWLDILGTKRLRDGAKGDVCEKASSPKKCQKIQRNYVCLLLTNMAAVRLLCAVECTERQFSGDIY